MTMRRAGLASALVLAMIAAGWLVGTARARAPGDERIEGDSDAGGTTPDQAGARAIRIADAVAAGRAWRLTTSHGPVHVWIPDGYHPDGAATVVYVHGYYTDVDGAWLNYQLPEQFALAGINAMFIAPEAPSGSRPPVYWTSLSDLLRTVHAGTGVSRPSGPLVAMGHSGAYRTLESWLDYPLLDTLITFDAMYAEIEPFRDWLEAAPARRLINVGDDTIIWTEDLSHQLQMVEVDRFPPDRLPPEVSTARAVYVRSQFGHMGLVTGGVAIPELLRALPVEILPDAPWDEPLGVLPRAIPPEED